MNNYSENKCQIENFIEKRLERKLKRDQKNLKILSEGDLQSCVYHHLRKFMDKKKMADWYIINKLPMGEQEEDKQFPDITIVHMRKGGKKVYSAFFIELKEDIRNFKKRRVVRDLKKLSALIKRHRNAEKSYFIYALLAKNCTPKESNESILKLWPRTLKGWLVPVTVNIYGEKQYLREFDGFERKLLKLRKYRSD